VADQVLARIEQLAVEVRAQGQVLRVIVTGAKLHNEMLARVLEEVTKKGDGSLGEMLAELVAESRHHTVQLDRVLATTPVPAPTTGSW